MLKKAVLLLVLVKPVIDDYSPSKPTLLVRTESRSSQFLNFTWDASLQSLLSCLVGQLFTSKSVLRL